MIVSGVVFRGGELLVMYLATSLQYTVFDMVLICYFSSSCVLTYPNRGPFGDLFVSIIL